MVQGDDDSAAGASFTIPELVCDTNQTFEIETEDFPTNLDAQTWEWVEFLPALHLSQKFRKRRLYRNSTDIVDVAQNLFSGFMAPNGEFPRWLPEDTLRETIRALQFLRGQGRATNYPFTLEQIKNLVNTEEENLIVPGVVNDSVEFLRVVNQLRRTRYILSDGRARGLEKIVGPGVIRTKRDRENSLGMIVNVNTRLESLLESLPREKWCFKLESANISEETRQQVYSLVQRPENEFRVGMEKLTVDEKREIVEALDDGIVNAVHAVGKDAQTGGKSRRGGAKGHVEKYGTPEEKAERYAGYQITLNDLVTKDPAIKRGDLLDEVATTHSVSSKTIARHTKDPRK